jgi:hypothetical protein
LSGEYNKHVRKETSDFVIAQTLLWTGIVASAGSSLYASNVLTLPTFVAAVLGAIPAVVLLVDKTFRFSERSRWHWNYRVRLKAIERGVRDQGLPLPEASKTLNALDLSMVGQFPGSSVVQDQKTVSP